MTKTIMENLGIDAKLLLAQLINFVLFFYIFKKFVAGPFMKFLQQEKQNEKEKEELLSKLKKGEEELLQREKQMKEKIKKERAELILKAQKDAGLVREEIIAKAKADADLVMVKAKKQLIEDRNKLYQEVKQKVADLSVFIVEKALQDFLDAEAKKKITTYILKNLGNSIDKHDTTPLPK